MDTPLVPGYWELASLVCKLMFYAGTAALVGGSISSLLYNDGSRRQLRFCLLYMLAACVLAFHAVVLNYLLQIGLINDAGLAGMFDWSLIRLLLDTGQGEATLLRMGGFVFAGMANGFFLYHIGQLRQAPSFLLLRQIVIFNFLGFLLIGLSQGRLGHVSVLALPARIAVVLHLMGIAFWIGALLPLHHLCSGSDRQLLQGIMKRFGDHAMWIVGALSAAGVYLVFQLLDTAAELFATPYGLALLLKIGLVVVILGIAAVNRYRLVPALLSDAGAAQMAKSIRWELVVAALVLTVTAYLSTVVGPPE
ncbi:MAG: CopD family protein [Gammaproteobacteria bacterium]